MKRLFGSGLRRSLAGSLGLKIAGLALSFLAAVILGRTLGVRDYGAYALAYSWLRLLSIPAGLGMDRLLVRNIAAYQVTESWGLIRGLMSWADRSTFVVSVALAGTGAAVVWAWRDRLGPELAAVFWVTLVLVPFVTRLRLNQAILRGFHHVIPGQVPEALVQPLLFVLAVVACWLVQRSGFSAASAMAMNLVSFGAALGLGLVILRRVVPREVVEAQRDHDARAWLGSGVSLMLLAGVQVLNVRVCVLLLGAMKGSEAVGLFSVANRGSDLITLAYLAFNTVLAPQVASLYRRGEIDRLQRLLTRGVRGIVLCSLPVAVVLVAGGPWFLSIFGRDFHAAHATLAILSVGELVNAATGPVGLILNMTGHERDTLRIVVLATAVNVALNLLLIPGFGLEGAAAAATSSQIAANVLLAVWAYRRVGLNGTVFSLPPRGPQLP